MVFPSTSGRPFSPRKRRCFQHSCCHLHQQNVFSAQAEVFLPAKMVSASTPGFLRASGGVSIKGSVGSLGSAFSPRKRRCFFGIRLAVYQGIVFSAQAEVFLVGESKPESNIGFLRASGGVSTLVAMHKHHVVFSPRKRRCFFGSSTLAAMKAVFSAQAEVFLWHPLQLDCCQGFLRASGGVSVPFTPARVEGVFSPRKRRCFLLVMSI